MSRFHNFADDHAIVRMQVSLTAYYMLSVHSTLVDRLGDQKDQVRDASITLLTNIMDVAASPQVCFLTFLSSCLGRELQG